MFDVNKEREAFEAWLIKKFDLPPKSFSLDFNDGVYDSIPTQARWEAWKERAKAQAVPETHLLIPKEPNHKTIMAMACVCLGSVGSGAEFLTLKEAKDVYSALVEKESGAEG
ncbi:TPA: hypothetical protein OUJ26_001146 [Acinetobacter baumannii]|nr:hypothetical protein [Acinetobacter baumannii]